MPPGRLRRYLDIPSTMINNIFGISIIDGTFEVSQAAITVDQHFPGMRERYHRKYGYSYEITSDRNAELMRLLKDTCRENGIEHDVNECFHFLRELPEKYEQLTLF